MNLLVLAKEPRPGRVKTRLCPPCSPVEAADLAAAALADTLGAALSSGAERVVLALDGRPGPWVPQGVQIVDQGTGRLDQRLAHAWSQVDGPTLQIGMDTPQVTGEELGAALEALTEAHVDATFGPALDGGWWAVGLRCPDPRAFLGVTTGRADTGERQRGRLVQLGLRVRDLPVARDVDDIDDALAVAGAAPATNFARSFRRMGYAPELATR